MLVLAGVGGASLRWLAWSSWGPRAPHHAPSHAHLRRFVGKIRTSTTDEKKIAKHRDRIRSRIKAHIEKAGLQLARAPNAGSYAKRTGLIRYVRGKSTIGGQDVDLPFVLTHRSGHSLDLRALLDTFHGWVKRSYSRSEITRTKSSIKLKLKTFGYSFDIVPMVAHPEHGRTHEYLYRADGTKVLTSVSQHVKFIRHRTQDSKKSKGVVEFNQMVRLFKWWSSWRIAEDDTIVEFPTFLLELLCAKVFDELGVAPTYTETLETWFIALASIVEDRREIRFDADGTVDVPQARSETGWVVRDPVNSANIIVPHRWTEVHIDRLALWLREGIEVMARVAECDRHDNGKGALKELEHLFGPGIGNLKTLEPRDDFFADDVIVCPCCNTVCTAPAMSTTTHNESHRRISNFVDWIRAPAEMEEKIRDQAEEIRSRIKGQASTDGLVVRSTPTSGSYAKRTGLRRHWNPKGGSPVEGQDVDLPFVVSPSTKDGERLDDLLGRFARYAATSYPSTRRSRSKSSVVLDFEASKLCYDLVPMLATDHQEFQILLRADGERRLTSVQRHVDFVRRRSQRSNEQPGRVKFNECVRLLKWWREFRVTEDPILKEVPTIVLDLLAAKAFDGHGVYETYTQTLDVWFGCLAETVRHRQRVAFLDYVAPPPANSRTLWEILDPVNPKNNVVPDTWGIGEINRLADWFTDAARRMKLVISYEQRSDVNNVVHELCNLFGSPFRHHSTGE